MGERGTFDSGDQKGNIVNPIGCHTTPNLHRLSRCKFEIYIYRKENDCRGVSFGKEGERLYESKCFFRFDNMYFILSVMVGILKVLPKASYNGRNGKSHQL